MGKFFDKAKYTDKFLTIAEVGQNHQGDLQSALNYIKKFSSLGADVLKFQTRNNKYLFDDESYNKLYNSENSFGNTYGEHREFLELSHDEVKCVRERCINEGVLFMSTPFDEPSLDFLCEINTDILKVASFDLGNLPFLKRMLTKRKPIVLSCGGGQSSHIRVTVDFLLNNKADFCVLHCVSKYPCPAEELGLKQITELLEMYPEVLIGLSDHYSSIVSGPIGYMLGARVFEKHVTFDRSLKGTDHSFALGPRGFENFVRDINSARKMNSYPNFADTGKEPVFAKLGKSIAAYKPIKKGDEFNLDNMRGRIFAKEGIPVRESVKLLGMKAARDIDEGGKIKWEDVIEK